MSVNYREPQWLLPNEKNLQYPAAGATQGSGLTADRHSLYSMDFDGNDDYVQSSAVIPINSVSLWFKPDATVTTGTGSGVLISFGTTDFRNAVYLGSNFSAISNELITITDQSLNYSYYAQASGTIDTNWHHLAIVHDGSKYQIYLDGSAVTTTGSTPLITSQQITIGARGNTTGSISSYFNGKIDEVAIFSRKISSSEITSLYNSGSPSNPMLLSGKPDVYYPLGEQARNPNGSSDWRFPNEVLQGQAINFDGTDHIEINNNNAFNFGTEDFAISAWVNTTGTPAQHRTVICKQNPSNSNEWSFQVNIDGKVMFLGDGGSSVIGLLSTTTVDDGNWHNILITRASGVFKLYVDSVLEDEDSIPNKNLTNTENINIGFRNSSYNGYFNGQMSNIVVWNSDQSANKDNIYNYGAPQTSYTVTPTAWYKLDKTSEYAGLNPNWHSALSFDGNNDYVDLTQHDLGTVNSISFWLKRANTDSVGETILGEPSNAFKQCINIDWASNVLYFKDPSNNKNTWSTLSSVNNTNWHHYLITRNGEATVLYLDGVSQGAGTVSGALTGNTLFRYLGVNYNTNTQWFEGEISNLAIYNQVISVEDVKYLYNGGTPQTNISFEPTSWYKLDNTTTGIQDSGSASNNGTNNGATAVSSSVAVDQWNFDNAVQSQTPNWSSALEFNGSSDYIDCGSFSGLDSGTAVTVSAWFKSSTYSNYGRVVSNNHIEIYQSLSAYSNTQGRFYYRLRGNFGIPIVDLGGTLASGVGNLVDGNWHHLCITFDNSTTTAVVYEDGVPVLTNTSVSGTLNSASSNLYIGSSSASTHFIDGSLSNISIFNTALDSTAVTALYNNGQPETAISSSPISWWKLDNTTTGIQDSVGSNDGTNSGATEIQTNVWTPRLNGESSTLPSSALISSDLQFNSAYSSFSLDFDGTNDYVDCGSPTIFDNLTSLSVSCWFNSDLKSQDRGILGKWLSGTDRSFALNLETSGNIRFVVRNSSATAASAYINTSDWSTGNWYNVIGTYDGSNVKVYLDGVLKDTASLTGTVLNTTHPFRIGKYHSTTAPFSGKIDETAVWDRALNQAEITSMYNNGYPKDITALAPISWWRLGEDAYFVSPDFIIPNKITGAPNGTSQNMTATDLVADAPGSYAAGLGSSLALADRIGDAPLSTANSLSFNMTPINRVSYPAGYIPTQADNVYSMDFDYANLTHINIGNISALNAVTKFSISVWVNPDNITGSNKEIFTIANNTSQAIVINHHVNELVYGVGPTSQFNKFNSALTAGVWAHLCFVFDGSQSSSADKFKLYKNGVYITPTSATQSTTITPTFTGDAFIGAWALDQTDFTFDGKMDEFAIFDYALSARQIKQDIYNGTTSGKTADLNNISNLTPPIAWYRMGD